jgi:uncharacterized protein YcnI
MVFKQSQQSQQSQQFPWRAALLLCAMAWATTGMGMRSAFAHVVLEEPVAATGSSYRATLRVGHGCNGSPTTGLRVRVPEGFTGAQPMPKPGWTLTAPSTTLAQPYEAHGKTITQGIVAVQWTANGPDNALPNAFYDEFVLRGNTPKKPGPLWFKVEQTCATGRNDWVEVPAKGTATRDLKAPAALLEVIEVLGTASAGHSH